VNSCSIIWPCSIPAMMVSGVISGALLVAVELVHRPEVYATSESFLASSGEGPILLALLTGAVCAGRLFPTDLALGRDKYLRVASVSTLQHLGYSVRRSWMDSVLVLTVLTVAAETFAFFVFPRIPLDVDYNAWPTFGAYWPVAEVVMWVWMVAVACFAASLVHLAVGVRLNRLLSVVFATLGPPVIPSVIPDPAHSWIEPILAANLWARKYPDGWWSWAGGGVMWALAAVAVAAAAMMSTCFARDR
jgi:hypothetical protein